MSAPDNSARSKIPSTILILNKPNWVYFTKLSTINPTTCVYHYVSHHTKMKQRDIDTFTRIIFYYSVVILGLYIVGVLLVFFGVIELDYIELKRAGKWDTYSKIGNILALPLVFQWIYCFRFFYKFDRYSGKFFFLLFFNVFYSPFYYHRVKIAKKPLSNKIEVQREPVLGRTIHLEDYEEEVIIKEENEKNMYDG